ncbi:flagellar biosynthesis protein FlgB [Thioclava sp. SK-1]|uniref:FlgB family protein n=1 Tax=Thioclava sp. SK-1 TaxID=1889770 RepID=UPI0008240DB7|nr:FlgB family protein [Thioclava sp. SK-1]OCX65390.1 flagellar biosynthesis protein FlgB [Thioclava sp. SK-1]
MFENMQIMKMAESMARHAAQRQTVVSQNMANANTPGYKAQDVAPFSETYTEGADSPMRATRAGHIGADHMVTSSVMTRSDPGTMSPNGNSVSVETEMVKAVEVKRQHDQALAIYKSTLNILRTSVSRS